MFTSGIILWIAVEFGLQFALCKFIQVNVQCYSIPLITLEANHNASL